VVTPSSSAELRPRGVEILDAPDLDPHLGRRSLRDVALANTLFGGAGAVVGEISAMLPHLPHHATLLDVGTGLGDIPARARVVARRAGITLDTVGLEAAEWVAIACRPQTEMAVVGSALALPFADASIDIVTCSQVLHHFFDDDARQLVRELDRVARRRVIISEIRRTRVAAAGIWAASFLLGFHPVSRHDGVVSVMRGFTTGELRDAVRTAIGHDAVVRRRPGFRITATWTPTAAGAAQ
jgi:SAM-dependent methyltransferase